MGKDKKVKFSSERTVLINVDIGFIEDGWDAWVTLFVFIIDHGRPGEVHDVDRDDWRLQQARARVACKGSLDNKNLDRH